MDKTKPMRVLGTGSINRGKECEPYISIVLTCPEPRVGSVLKRVSDGALWEVRGVEWYAIPRRPGSGDAVNMVLDRKAAPLEGDEVVVQVFAEGRFFPGDRVRMIRDDAKTVEKGTVGRVIHTVSGLPPIGVRWPDGQERDYGAGYLEKLPRPPEARPAPPFQGFAASLREEIRWLSMIHSSDNTGQAASDIRSLAELARHVENVGKRLGYV